MENKQIKLPNGNTLELSVTPAFLEKVAQQFSFDSAHDVTDEHIRAYLFGALKTAIDKAEKDGIYINNS